MFKNMRKFNIKGIAAAFLALLCVAASGCGGKGDKVQSGSKSSGLVIPEFSKINYKLKNTHFTVELCEKGGEWQSVTPYTVKVNNNARQNTEKNDPQKESPMVSFVMGNKPVSVRIKADFEVKKASVHPKSAGIEAEIKDGAVLFTVDEPRNICVRLNDDMYELVYIFANEYEDIPNGDRVIKAGKVTAPRTGSGSWKGGLSNMTVYESALSAAQIADISNGGDTAGYSYRWKLNDGFESENGKTGKPELLGEPKIGDCGGKKALIMNGYEDAVSTGVLLNAESGDFTLSGFVYLDKDGEDAVRGLFGGLMYIRSNGTIGSNLGDWEYPYDGQKKITSGKWHHVALVKRGNELTGYVDGVADITERRQKGGNEYIILGAAGVTNAIYVKSGETLVLSGGAVVEGNVIIYGAQNASINGYGMVLNGNIQVAYSKNAEVRNVTVSNPSTFNLSLQQSSGVNITNFKCFSSYGASDGINSKASDHITVDRCFIRANDDTISFYATSVNCLGSSSDYLLKNSTLISDAGHNVLMGVHAKSGAGDTIKNFKAENIDVLGSNSSGEMYQGVLAVNAGDDCSVDNVEFDNIRIEEFRINQLFNIRVFKNGNYNKSPGKAVTNVKFSNITYNGNNAVCSQICGYNEARRVSGVSFKNVVLNGEKLKDGNNKWLKVGDFADNVTFE